jgi:methyltransferase
VVISFVASKAKDRTTPSLIAFVFIVAALAVQRLIELRLSRRNEARILSQGGREHAPDQFKWMKTLHTSWFVAMLAEVWWLRRPFRPLLGAAAFLILLAGQSLRYAAIRTLGRRWTVRVMTLPDAPPVSGGIYRYLRHPNYVGVMLEVAAVPLLHGAYLTSLTFSLANALLLTARIRAEERALAAHNRYQAIFAEKPRFLPWLPWRQ